MRNVNEWAPAWCRDGWQRKRGAITNLDLVKELLKLAEAHPRCRVKWTRGHAANPCNEYADRLAARRARSRRPGQVPDRRRQHQGGRAPDGRMVYHREEQRWPQATTRS